MFRVAVLLMLGAAFWSQQDPEMPDKEPIRWKAFSLEEIDKERAAKKHTYLEFLRVPTLSSGLYVLPAGSVDKQSPHGQDEVYYIVSGKAQFTVDGEEVAVESGSVLFVKKGVEHRFHDIEEDLEVLVFFSSAVESKKAEKDK